MWASISSDCFLLVSTSALVSTTVTPRPINVEIANATRSERQNCSVEKGLETSGPTQLHDNASNAT